MIRTAYNESLKLNLIEVHMQEEFYIVKDMLDDDECEVYMTCLYDHLCENVPGE